MLAFANVPDGGPVQLRESSKDTCMKFRYDSIQGTVISVAYNQAMEQYQWRVDSINEGYKPEGIWCRICGEKNGHVCGRMMNKPYGNFGVSNGDVIEIELVDVDGELKAVALLQN